MHVPAEILNAKVEEMTDEQLKAYCERIEEWLNAAGVPSYEEEEEVTACAL